MNKKVRGMYFRFMGKTYIKQDALIGVCFMIPALILGMIFVIAPMAVSLSYAFTDAYMLRLDNVHWNGVRNFINVFKDDYFWNALKNTLEFVIKVVPLQLCAAMGLALILNSKIKGNTFFRWAFFCPVMLSLAVTSFLWMNLLNEQEGLINALLGAVGISSQPFLKSPSQAMNVIVFISAWQGAGYQMLIFLSGLKNIPPEIYEAAAVDGANASQKFFRITLPNLISTLSFVLITMLIGAFRLITQPMIMTGGGPVDSTMTMSYYIYSQGITFRQVGYSSAIAMVYTVFMATIALTLRRVMEAKD